MTPEQREVIEDWIDEHEHFPKGWHWGALTEVLEALIEEDERAQQDYLGPCDD